MAVRVDNRPIEMRSIDAIKPYENNPRRHSTKDVDQLIQMMRRFGFRGAIWVEPDGTIIAGHGRYLAAKKLGLKQIPVIVIDDLPSAKIRALRIADNRSSELSQWDASALKVEFEILFEEAEDFEITDTGFENAVIDGFMIDSDELARPETMPDAALEGPSVAQRSDLFLCGSHRLLCGDAKLRANLQRLMDAKRASVVISDPPYNTTIVGFVTKSKHAREFHEASGEMMDEQYEDFLEVCLANMAGAIVDGGLVYLYIDWRHVDQMMRAGRAAFGTHVTTAVWDKGSGGMGSFYRSAHEFCCVFKFGDTPHINNVQLGRHGRNRSNVWRYPGLASFGKGRKRTLAMHPTVKPVAMIADALLDSSNRGDIVLDPFAGSGTVLVAAHRTGRIAYAMEIDPAYCDVALRRFRAETGIDPVHTETGLTLSELERQADEVKSASSDEETAS